MTEYSIKSSSGTNPGASYIVLIAFRATFYFAPYILAETVAPVFAGQSEYMYKLETERVN